MVKNWTANAGKIRDTCSIPGSGRSPGGGPATHSNILAWRILWTEEPGGLQSMGLQSVGQDQATNTFTFEMVILLMLAFGFPLLADILL